MPKSIQQSIISGFTVFAIVPIFILVVALGWFEFQENQQRAILRQQETAARLAVEIKALIEVPVTMLITRAKSHGIKGNNIESRYKDLSVLLASNRAFRRIVSIKPDGKELFRVSRDEASDSFKGRDWSDKPAFAVPKARGTIYYDNVAFDELLGEPFMVIAVPVYTLNSRELNSVLVSTIQLKGVWDLLFKQRSNGDQDLFILDGNRRVIAHQNPSIVLRGTISSRDKDDGFLTGLSGRWVAAGSQEITIGDNTFRVVAERKGVSALLPAVRSTSVVVLITGIALIVILVLLFRAIQHIARPIQDLASAAQGVGAGNYSQRVKVSGEGEIDVLANAFNDMAVNLEQTLGSLHKEVSEHKQAKESLANTKQLLEEAERLAGIGHWVVYPDTGKLFWSDEIYRIHGFEAGGEIDLEAAINVYHPDDREKVAEYVRRAIEEKENYDFELRLIRADGETRYVRSTGIVRLKPNGGVDSVFGVFHDITERKNYEAELNRHRNNLEELVKERTREIQEKDQEILESHAREQHASKMVALGEMASNIGHEINNPLQAILLVLYRIKLRAGDDSEILGSVEKIDGLVMRMSSIIDSLKKLSRDASEEPFRETPVKEIVEDVASLTTERFSVNGVDFSIRYHDNCGDALLRCRHIQISQVLMNLLNNSFDAVQDLDDKWIYVDVYDLGETIRISVTDSGAGISEDIRDDIFAPLFTTKETGKGTGIGLSISSDIIRNHNGTLKLDSDSSNTRFVFELPKASKHVEKMAES